MKSVCATEGEIQGDIALIAEAVWVPLCYFVASGIELLLWCVWNRVATLAREELSCNNVNQLD